MAEIQKDIPPRCSGFEREHYISSGPLPDLRVIDERWLDRRDKVVFFQGINRGIGYELEPGKRIAFWERPIVKTSPSGLAMGDVPGTEIEHWMLAVEEVTEDSVECRQPLPSEMAEFLILAKLANPNSQYIARLGAEIMARMKMHLGDSDTE